MSLMETVAQQVFSLVLQNAKVDLTVNGNAQKVACAFPKGEDPAGFGPWSNQEVKQVSFEADPITTAGVEIDFRVSYKTSAALQFVDQVFVDVLTKVPVPYSLDAKVEFRPVETSQNSDGLEMAAIPFVVSVTRSHPIFGISQGRADGTIQGDGQSSFSTFQVIAA